MTNITRQPLLSQGEFIALIAFMTSFVALATDAMLPALPSIGESLGVSNENDTQLIISLMFLGLAVGQYVYGPWSDAIGRKRTIYVGFAIFLLGSFISYLAQNFFWMILGRILQGVGLAGPRVVTMALVRDLYEGRAMARIMSFVSAVFIIVPAIAPALGLLVLAVADWRAIFGSFIILGVVGWLWFGIRQPETLPTEKRIPVRPQRLWANFCEIITNRQAIGYTVSSGFVFASFVTYLSTAQQVFQDAYALPSNDFAVWFAILALFIGGASVINGWIVMKYGMRKLTMVSMVALLLMSSVFLAITLIFNGIPPFWFFIASYAVSFFCLGILFGNMMALCMEPLGHIAGIGAAVTSATSNLISIPLAIFFGGYFDGTVTPMASSFVVLTAIGLAIMIFVERGRKND